MAYRLITPPAIEPVTLDQIKADASLFGTRDDSRIESVLIPATRGQAESITGRALITQTWELVLDDFPLEEIRIWKAPVQSITSVKYYDTNGTLTTLAADQYVLDADTPPAWLLPAEGVSWPSTHDAANSVIIRFVAGYGDSADDVPKEILAWIRAHCAAEADAKTGGTQVKVTEFVESLLDAYRLKW